MKNMLYSQNCLLYKMEKNNFSILRLYNKLIIKETLFNNMIHQNLYLLFIQDHHFILNSISMYIMIL